MQAKESASSLKAGHNSLGRVLELRTTSLSDTRQAQDQGGGRGSVHVTDLESRNPPAKHQSYQAFASKTVEQSEVTKLCFLCLVTSITLKM